MTTDLLSRIAIHPHRLTRRLKLRTLLTLPLLCTTLCLTAASSAFAVSDIERPFVYKPGRWELEYTGDWSNDDSQKEFKNAQEHEVGIG